MLVRPTTARLDMSALGHNLANVQARSRHGRVLCVVKADAYGHGSTRVGAELIRCGAWGLAVSLLEEAVALREGGLGGPIVVLGGIYPGFEDLALTHGLSAVVWEPAQIDRLANASARGGGRKVSVHVKIDTGMGRLGAYMEELPDVLEALRRRRASVSIEGVMTHFAATTLAGPPTHAIQRERFTTALAEFGARGLELGFVHAANSLALFGNVGAEFDLVRPGLALYGVEPLPTEQRSLRPVLHVSSRISAMKRARAGEGVSYGWREVLARDSHLAIVPVGYEDGYPFRATGRAEVLVRGRRCRVLGAVTMDALVIDATDVDARVGDPVVLIGDDGEAAITVTDLAEWAGSIPYEILCGISKRVPRS